MSAILFCLFGSAQTLESQLDRSTPLVSPSYALVSITKTLNLVPRGLSVAVAFFYGKKYFEWIAVGVTLSKSKENENKYMLLLIEGPRGD